jgi:hypothetical protein
VSEQMAEQTGSETGSVSAEPAVPNSSDARSEPATASAGQPAEILPPKQAEASEAPKADAKKPGTSKQEAPRTPGEIMIMSPGDRGWGGPEIESEPSSRRSGKRRFGALAAVAVLAAATGALGGALATTGLGHFIGDDAASGNRALEAALVRIDADISNLKVSLEHTSKVGMTQFNKTSERLDKVEKAQTEPAAKLARLSEAVEKLRVVPVTSVAAAVTPVAAREVTGSIAPVATMPAVAAKSEVAKSEVAKSEVAKFEVAKSEVAKSEVAKSEAAKTDVTKPEAAKTEVARLPTVEGWVLRDVDRGSALIEGRRGVFEVYAGDPVPGLGRVDAIRRQDGRWVVVTSKGLIVAR